MSRPYSVHDGDSYMRQLERRLQRLERVGVLTGAANFLRIVQANALIRAVPEDTEHVYVLPVDPALTEVVGTGDVWKDTSYPNPIIRVWDGAAWIKSEDPALDRAMESQTSTIDIYRNQGEPPPAHRPDGSLWLNPDDGMLMRWQGDEWQATPLPGDGQLDVIREDIDAAMIAANGKNKITYTDINPLIEEPPGPAPAPDPDRTLGDVHRNRDAFTHTIYAEWQWDGATWVSVDFGDMILRSLDVGKLTAGAADINTGVINKFWSDQAWIDQANVSILTVASVTPEMLTSGEELSVNPTWSRAEVRTLPPYVPGTGMSFETGATYQYRDSTHVLRINGSATGETQITDTFPVTPGELIFVRAIARQRSSGISTGFATAIKVYWLDADDDLVDDSLYEVVTTSTTYATYETIFDVPDGAVRAYVSLDGGPRSSLSADLVAQTSVRRTMSSIDDDGIQTVVSPEGVTVSILVPTDDGYERVALTQMGRFYSAFNPETGNTSTMTGDSVSSGVVAARDDVTIGGESVLAALAASGGRITAFDRANVAGATSQNEIGYREWGFEADAGQAYLLVIQMDVLVSSAGQSFVYLRKTEAPIGSDAPPPTIAGTSEFARVAFYATGGGEQVYILAAFVPNASENTRWLISGRSGGTRTMQIRSSWAYAIRLGNFQELPSSGRYSDGGASPVVPPPPQEYVHTSTFAWSRTFNNFNSDPSAWVDSDMVRQGRGGQSNYLGLLGMSTAARNAAMAGDISKVEVYLYHDGPTPSGTARISTHRQASAPAYSSGTSITLYDSYTTRSMNRESDAWITLPSSTHAAFESGLTRGIAVGSTGTGWNLMDFANQLHLDPDLRPKIRITYVK